MDIKPGLVSVIMSNYNTPETYLREAIESVVNQTYKNFEFIIVDDCSTNDSVEIIKSYSDSRVKIIVNNENKGITKSLNIALNYARGEYIARMDADDICFPERLENQVAYLKANPDVIVCGTWIELFGDGAYKFKKKYSCKEIPEKDVFQINLLFGNHINIVHPTAMFRHKMLIENSIKYDERYMFAQDYKMWVSCSRIGECRNVSKVLLKYRVHDKAVSSNKRRLQFECTQEIIKEQLRDLQLELPKDYEQIHFGFLTGRKKYSLHYKKWIIRIIKHNKKQHIYNRKKLETVLWNKWAEISYFNLYKVEGLGRIKVIVEIPIRCYKEIFNIWKKRRGKENNE